MNALHSVYDGATGEEVDSWEDLFLVWTQQNEEEKLNWDFQPDGPIPDPRFWKDEFDVVMRAHHAKMKRFFLDGPVDIRQEEE